MGEGNILCSVFNGLVVTLMFCFSNVRRSASVIPLMYGKVAYPLGLSLSARRLKNCPTSSSGDGTRVLEVKSLKICLTILSGYPLHLSVACCYVVEFVLLASMCVW